MGSDAIGQSYGRRSAFIFVFNLVVGVGALNLPYSFDQAGLVLGIVMLTGCAALSYMTLTFLLEVMGAANAVINHFPPEELKTEQAKSRALGKDASSDNLADAALGNPTNAEMNGDYSKLPNDNDLGQHLSPVASDEERAQAQVENMGGLFTITRRIEIGRMAELFLGKWGKFLFYLILVIYLFGDLSIYVVAVSKTLAQNVPDFTIFSVHFTSDGDDLSKYRFFVALFTVCVVPFSLFNFQKTKPLQILTMAIRNIAFVIMIFLPIIFLFHDSSFDMAKVQTFNFNGLSSIFGGCVYAFMCHHSLPSIVSPIKRKKQLPLLFAGDYTLILMSYLLLSISAMLAFSSQTAKECDPTPGPACQVQSLYTLNFLSYDWVPISKFLGLFPVFTITMNFPLIAITLRNNLLQLLFPSDTSNSFARQAVLSLVACLPPIAIAVFTDDVAVLVNFTGSYAGSCIQFIFPSALVIAARIRLTSLLGKEGPALNTQQSPFSSIVFPVIAIAAGFAAMGYSTYINIDKYS